MELLTFGFGRLRAGFCLSPGPKTQSGKTDLGAASASGNFRHGVIDSHRLIFCTTTPIVALSYLSQVFTIFTNSLVGYEISNFRGPCCPAEERPVSTKYQAIREIEGLRCFGSTASPM